MRRLRTTLVVGLLLGGVGAAEAIDVNFSGTVSNTCTLSVPVAGVLALSADGLTLGSEQTGGLPAQVAILSLGANTVTVAAPTRTQSPAGYTASGEQLSVAYSGLGGLSLVNQAYATTTTSFVTPILPLTILVVNNRIVNNNGFAQGQYKTTTVVTCS